MDVTPEYLDDGDIPKGVYLGVLSIFFTLSIIASSVRLAMKWRQYKRFEADDYFLISAVCTYMSAAILLFVTANEMYFTMVLNVNQNTLFALQTVTTPGFFDRVTRLQKKHNAISCLILASIFLVKFAFLAFFRQMVDRMKSMTLYWKFVSIVTAMAAVVSVALPVIGCPKYGLAALECTTASGVKQITIVNSVLAGLDIVTDLLIMLIPMTILWWVRIKLRQKFALGIFLCLSFVMIIIAIIRVSRQNIDGNKANLTWAFFWQVLEASVAIVMVSITAFRSLLGIKSAKKHQRGASVSYHRNFSPSQTGGAHDGEQMENLPPIPQAKLITTKFSADGV